jgi:hypothetical protein
MLLIGAALWPFYAVTPAHAQEQEFNGPTLVLPANGAFVDEIVTVRIGFAGRNGRGPAEGTGISNDRSATPFQPKSTERSDPEDSDSGPDEGMGFVAPTEKRVGLKRFALLIDSAMPEHGSVFTPDERHIYFPAGLPQMNVKLAPGVHHLLLVALDRNGLVAKRNHKGAKPITVTVK